MNRPNSIFYTLSRRLVAILAACLPLLSIAQQQGQNADFRYAEVVENSTFLYSLPNGIATAIMQPEHGTLSFQSSPSRLIYTPDGGFNGIDSIVVEIYNSWPLSINYVALELHVRPSIVKAVPDYITGSVNTTINNIDVLSNDSSTLGGLSISRLALLNDGTASINADSSAIDFTPAPQFTGLAGVIYTVCDGAGACDQGMLIIRVSELSATPDSFHHVIGKNERLPLVLPDDNFDEWEAPSHGSVIPQGDLVALYIPDEDYHGPDEFSFMDEDGIIASYTIDILNKAAQNRFARPDIAYISTHTDSVVVDITANDFRQWNINPNNLSLTQQPQFGSASLDQSTGLVTYTPNAGFEGIDVFEYELFFPIPWTKEKAKIYVVVSNQQPLNYTFDLACQMNTPRVMTYGALVAGYSFDIDVQPSNGTLEFFPGDTTLILLGEEVSGTNMLIYTPNEAYTSDGTPDEFEVSYCVDGNSCVSVKVKMSVEDNGPGPHCIGSDCLWPGDANADGLVNMTDVMSIGLAMGEQGPQRPGASNHWVAQSAPQWQYAGLPFDAAFADCDGDGAVTEADVSVVAQHYLNTKTIVPNIPSPTKQNSSLQIVTPPPYLAGDLLEVDVLYGNNQDPVYDGYGLSFSFVYNPDLIVDSSLQVTFPEDSWLAYSSPVLSAGVKPADGRLDFAVSRTNGVTVTGKGRVARLSFIIEEDLQGIRSGSELSLFLGLTNGIVMDGYGHLSGLMASGLEIPVSLVNEDEAYPQQPQVVAFPNPAPGAFSLYLNGTGEIREVSLFSVSGEQVAFHSDLGGSLVRLDVPNLTPGMYIARITTTHGVVSQKIQIVPR